MKLKKPSAVRSIARAETRCQAWAGKGTSFLSFEIEGTITGRLAAARREVAELCPAWFSFLCSAGAQFVGLELKPTNG